MSAQLTADASVHAPPPPAQPGEAVRLEPGAQLQQADNLLINGDLRGALVVCGGEIHLPDGAIVGGRVAAFRRLTCHTAGDASQTPTDIVVGFDEAFLDGAERRVAEIAAATSKANDFRSKLEPLLHNQRALTSAQKEHITNLLYQAADAEKRAAAAVRQLQAQCAAMKNGDRPECLVTETLHPGVTVRFPGACVTINQPLAGPVKLFAVREGGEVSIHATNPKSGWPVVVQSIPQLSRVDALLATLERLAHG